MKRSLSDKESVIFVEDDGSSSSKNAKKIKASNSGGPSSGHKLSPGSSNGGTSSSSKQRYGNLGGKAKEWSKQFRNTDERPDTSNAIPENSKRKRDDDVISISSTDSSDEDKEAATGGRTPEPGTNNKRRRPPDPAAQEHVVLPDPQVFSHPSQQFRMGLNPDPADFRPVADFLSRPIPEHIIHTENNWKSLTKSVMEEFCRSQPTYEAMLKKIDLWTEIYRIIRLEYDCGLFIFGSTFNGFGGRDSDVDMCLFMDRGQFLQPKQKLDTVRRLLRQHFSRFIRGGILLVPAKVPILKFKETVANIDVDFSVDNHTSIRNTHLLFYYSLVDYRVRPLVIAVKRWAKRHNLNDASSQTISSYGWTLMVIHYLQFGVQPQVVPCLHEMYPNIFHSESNIFNLDYSDTPNFESKNTKSLGSLLVGFFGYYSNRFRYSRDVASIRTGITLSKDSCESYARKYNLSPGQWRAHLLLEEPFDRTNAARAVCNESQFERIRSVLRTTWNHLRGKQDTKITLYNL
eukprot:TRINITY_DN32899_c0_g1_i1.p1 TRINITY_DN32899_c0_g1~~TRINITY_DN32899_c0_g1_i1.p1  ORF type:complete len:516 (-),score=114.26 TRINITY_DN32899_c0_g1_i1:429-1976(-)